MKEIVKSPEQQKQLRIAELEKSMNDVQRLIDENLVSRAAKDKLLVNLEGYRNELDELNGSEEKLAA